MENRIAPQYYVSFEFQPEQRTRLNSLFQPCDSEFTLPLYSTTVIVQSIWLSVTVMWFMTMISCILALKNLFITLHLRYGLEAMSDLVEIQITVNKRSLKRNLLHKSGRNREYID